MAVKSVLIAMIDRVTLGMSVFIVVVRKYGEKAKDGVMCKTLDSTRT